MNHGDQEKRIEGQYRESCASSKEQSNHLLAIAAVPSKSTQRGVAQQCSTNAHATSVAQPEPLFDYFWRKCRSGSARSENSNRLSTAAAININ